MIGVGEIVVVPVIAEIVEAEVVELLVTLGGIGLGVNVSGGRAAKPVASLILPACFQQGIRIGVIEPRVLRPDPLAGQFGTLQYNDGRIKQALVATNAGFDDPQLDPRVVVRSACIRSGDDIQGPVQSTKSALTVRHQRQVTTAAG